MDCFANGFLVLLKIMNAIAENTNVSVIKVLFATVAVLK